MPRWIVFTGNSKHVQLIWLNNSAPCLLN